ncbi:unnamed protein product, partial [Mesorhabditis spiculigera]
MSDPEIDEVCFEVPPQTGDRPTRNAAEVFIFMHRCFRASRNIRAHWFLEHLNKTVEVPRSDARPCLDDTKNDKYAKEMEVLGVIPEGGNADENVEGEKFLITMNTKVTYISRYYRHVFVLDISPSTLVADDCGGAVVYTKVLENLRMALYAVTKSFKIPGTNHVFTPQIYVTICVFTPFLCFDQDLVLTQGIFLTESMVDQLLDKVTLRFRKLVKELHKFTQPIFGSWATRRRQNRVKYDSTCEPDLTAEGDGELRPPTKITARTILAKMTKKMNSAEQDQRDAIDDDYPLEGTMKYRRKIWKCSRECGGCDGSCDYVCDGYVKPEWALIFMLRLGLVAVQMLPENTQSNIVIITDAVCGMPDAIALQQLLTQLRSYTISCSFIQINGGAFAEPSFGHVSSAELFHFLAMATFGTFLPNCTCCLDDQDPELRRLGPASIQNSNSPARRVLSLRQDREEEEGKAGRMASGGSVGRRPSEEENQHIRNMANKINPEFAKLYQDENILVEIEILAPFHVMRDILTEDGDFVDMTRQKGIKVFRRTLDSLIEADRLLLHLHSFNASPQYYTIPFGVSSRYSLFRLIDRGRRFVVEMPRGDQHTMTFVEFWKVLCNLDEGVWQKWVHSHCERLLLRVDEVPIDIFRENLASEITCEEANNHLHELLRDETSFCLLHQLAYVKFIYGDDPEVPKYFYMIRICSAPPAVTIKMAFLGGISSSDRRLDADALVVVRRPVERILVRYRNVPLNLRTMVRLGDEIDRGEDVRNLVLHNSLAKYLNCRRRIWNLPSIFEKDVILGSSRDHATFMLHTILYRRLREGFNIAWAENGIVGLCRQVVNETGFALEQYVYFPPQDLYLPFKMNRNRLPSTCRTTENAQDKEDYGIVFEPDAPPKSRRRIQEPATYQLVGEYWSEPMSDDDYERPSSSRDDDLVSALFTLDQLIKWCDHCHKNNGGAATLAPMSAEVLNLQGGLPLLFCLCDEPTLAYRLTTRHEKPKMDVEDLRSLDAPWMTFNPPTHFVWPTRCSELQKGLYKPTGFAKYATSVRNEACGRAMLTAMYQAINKGFPVAQSTVMFVIDNICDYMKREVPKVTDALEKFCGHIQNLPPELRVRLPESCYLGSDFETLFANAVAINFKVSGDRTPDESEHSSLMRAGSAPPIRRRILKKYADIPLFVFFNCTIEFPDRTMSSFPVQHLPYCVQELIDNCPEKPTEPFELKDVRVRVEMYVLSWPIEDEADPGRISTSEEREKSYAKRRMLAFRDSLPAAIQEVIKKLLKNVERLIEMEMVLIEARKQEVTLEQLRRISAFISKEYVEYADAGGADRRLDQRNKPLQLVINLPDTVKKLKSRLDGITVENCVLKKVGDEMFYCMPFDETEKRTRNESRRASMSKSRQVSGEAGLGAQVSPLRERKPSSSTALYCDGRPVERSEAFEDFWLILTVSEENLLFQLCRRQTDRHDRLFSLIWRKVKQTVRVLNQEMLLMQTLQTRKVDLLLLAPPESDRFVGTKGYASDDDFDVDPSSHLPIKQDARFHYAPGYFACEVQFEHWFTLHPRVRQSRMTNMSGMGSLSMNSGVEALKRELEPFKVANSNLTNVYILSAPDENVLYMILHVNRGSVSHTVKNAPKPWKREAYTKLEQQNALLLTIHGVREPRQEYILEFIDKMQKRLDNTTLHHLSTMLEKNAHSRLEAADVQFIQKDCRSPSTLIYFGIPNCLAGYLQAIYIYMHQQLITLDIHPARCKDESGTNAEHTSFRSLPPPNNYIPNDYQPRFSLFVRPIKEGNKTNGIACLEMRFVNERREIVELSNGRLDKNTHTTFMRPDDPVSEQIEHYKSLLSFRRVEEPGQREDTCAYLEVAAWQAGDVGFAVLKNKLEQCLRMALCDVLTEYGLLNDVVVGLEQNLPMSPPTASLQLHFTFDAKPNTSFGSELDKLSKDEILREELISDDFLRCAESYWSMIIDWAKVQTPSLLKAEVEFDAPDTHKRVLSQDTVLQEQTRRTIPLQERLMTILESVPMREQLQDRVLVARRRFDGKYEVVRTNPVAKSADLLNPALVGGFDRSFSGDERSAFVPRRRLFYGIVRQEKLTCFLYNFKPDLGRQIVQQITRFVHWHNGKMRLVKEIGMHKMGYQHLGESDKNSDNPFFEQLWRQPDEVLADELPEVARERRQGRNVSFHSRTPSVIRMHYADTLDRVYRHARTAFLVRKYFGCVWKDQLYQFIMVSGGFLSASAYSNHDLEALALPSDLPEPWNIKILYLLVAEYSEYLKKIHGLEAISITNPCTVTAQRRAHRLQYDKKCTYPPEVWLYKATPEGLILLHLHFQSPYFVLEMHTWEATAVLFKALEDVPQSARDHSAELSNSVSRLLSGLHFHSFTYDFHLRMLANFLSGRDTELFKSGYDTNAFLADFLQYYGCRPAYAQNCVYEERLAYKLGHSIRGQRAWGNIVDSHHEQGWKALKLKQNPHEAVPQTEYVLVSSACQEDLSPQSLVVRALLYDIEQAKFNSHSLFVIVYLIQIVPPNEPIKHLTLAALQKATRMRHESAPSNPGAIPVPSLRVDPLDGEMVVVATPMAERLPIPAFAEKDDDTRRRFSSGGVLSATPSIDIPLLKQSNETDSYVEPKTLMFPHSPRNPGREVDKNDENKDPAELVDDEDDDDKTIEDDETKSETERETEINDKPSRRHRHQEATGDIPEEHFAFYVTFVSEKQKVLQRCIEDSMDKFKAVLQEIIENTERQCRVEEIWVNIVQLPPRTGVEQKKAIMNLLNWTRDWNRLADHWKPMDYAKHDTSVPEELDLMCSLVKSIKLADRIPYFNELLADVDHARLCRHLLCRYGPQQCKLFIYKTSYKKVIVVINPNFIDQMFLVKFIAPGRTPEVEVLFKEVRTDNRSTLNCNYVDRAVDEILHVCMTFIWSEKAQSTSGPATVWNRMRSGLNMSHFFDSD